ncbi:sigma-70 family RNA polymerase sigma factor [Zhongshania sp.]|uniref:sigma-70 family RNA polymerase sigma factor n=1 Tax=Zhongshania sp. TaxID=1971902 RepID=UPI0035667970
MAELAVEQARNGEFWADCVERIAQERDKHSFVQLFDYFSPRVNAYLLGQGAEPAVAEDLSQEALLALWNKAHLYSREKAAVSTWLFRVARNLWIDRLRKQRGIAYELDENLAETVDDEARLNADGERLKAVLGTLPQSQAQVVYKSYYEGKSHSEIAGETGMPLGSVKSSLRLAIKAFRQHFGEDSV